MKEGSPGTGKLGFLASLTGLVIGGFPSRGEHGERAAITKIVFLIGMIKVCLWLARSARFQGFLGLAKGPSAERIGRYAAVCRIGFRRGAPTPFRPQSPKRASLGGSCELQPRSASVGAPFIWQLRDQLLLELRPQRSAPGTSWIWFAIGALLVRRIRTRPRCSRAVMLCRQSCAIVAPIRRVALSAACSNAR